MTSSSTDLKSADSGLVRVVKRAAFYFAVLVFMALLIALLLPPLVHGPRPRRMSQCKRNLRNIVIALHNYHDFYESFPPAVVTDAQGRPLYSWRVLLLPFIDHADVYHNLYLDEPWDSPHNGPLLDIEVSAFRCPEDDVAKTTDETWTTSYVAVVGPETVWPAPNSCRFVEITDGLSYTIAVVEFANSGIHWAEPRDLLFSEISLQLRPTDGLGLPSGHEGGRFVALCDGHVRFIPDTTPPKTIRALLTRAGGEDVGDDY